MSRSAGGDSSSSKAIHSPSGDHDGAASSLTLLSVTRAGVPPFQGITEMFGEGRAPRSEDYIVNFPSVDQLASVSLSRDVVAG